MDVVVGTSLSPLPLGLHAFRSVSSNNGKVNERCRAGTPIVDSLCLPSGKQEADICVELLTGNGRRELASTRPAGELLRSRPISTDFQSQREGRV